MKIAVELQLIVRNVHRKTTRRWLQFTFLFLFINSTFKNSTPLAIKNTKKLLVIYEFVDHISRTYSWINHINIWFAKVIIILIRTIQVLIFDPWSSDLCLNVVEREIGISCIFPYFGLQDLLLFYWQYLQKIWFLMVVLKSGKFVIVMEII